MADRNEQVMEVVRRELDSDPGVALDVLFDKAKEIDPSVASLSPRQFHARYPLQVKRERGRDQQPARSPSRRKSADKPARKPRKTPAEAPGGSVDRDAIRNLFMEFASEFAEAESRQEIVRVLSSIDGYVDRVQKLVGSK